MEKPEKLKENVGKLYDYLPEDKKEELEEILRYGKEIKERGEEKKKEFWGKYTRDDFINLIKYKRNLNPKEEEILGKMSGITREKFIEEYLHDDILYSTELTGKEEKKEGKKYRYEDLKRGGLNFGEFDYLFLPHLGIGSDLAKELSKMELKNGVTLYLNDNKIGDEGAKAISKMELKNGVTLYLDENGIGDDGAKAISGMKLKDGVKLNLLGNGIGDDGAKAISGMKLKDGVSLNLVGNNIGDEGAEWISKMELKEGVYLGLGNNNIGDKGAEALSKMELKDGVTLDLSRNEISDDMEKELKKWEQSYRDKGINCEVKV